MRQRHHPPAIWLVIAVISASLLAAACSGAATLAPVPSPTPAPTPVVTPTPKPSPTPKPPTRVPPRPTGVSFRKIEEIITDAATGEGTVRVRLDWDEADGVADSFKVWGLTRCVNASKKTNKKPCLVAGQSLKKGDLELVDTFRGTARSGTIEIPLRGEATANTLFDSSDYYGLLLGAYNAKGESVLAIIATANVCWGCAD